MKKFFILTLLIVGNYIHSDCPEVLDHKIRILDSSESINLCKYDKLAYTKLVTDYFSSFGYSHKVINKKYIGNNNSNLFIKFSINS